MPTDSPKAKCWNCEHNVTELRARKCREEVERFRITRTADEETTRVILTCPNCNELNEFTCPSREDELGFRSEDR